MFHRNCLIKFIKTFHSSNLYTKNAYTQVRCIQKAVHLRNKAFHNSFKNLTTENVGKIHKETENQYAHKVLETSLKSYQLINLTNKDVHIQNELQNAGTCPEFILNPPASVDEVHINDLFQQFCFLADYCRLNNVTIADERFTKFIDLYCRASHLLNDDQLLETLKQMSRMPSTKSTRDKNFVELWNELDIECEHRIPQWDSSKLLLMCDTWYHLHLGRVSEFVWEAMRKLGRKVLKMPPEQLVQTMFFCNVLRKPLIDMFDFEVNLVRCAHQLSLKELGVMAMGFFKTETPIRNPKLIEHIYKRLIKEIDTVEDITLVSLLKILKYSTKLNQSELLCQLLERIGSQVHRMSLLSCLHAVLLGSDLQIYDEALLESVIKRFLNELPTARLKDLERLCLIISLMNYSHPEGLDQQICEEILKSLKTRIDEIIRHPRSLPLCLHFLSLKGFYDQEMISAVLDPRYINHAYGKNLALGREIFQLDSFVKINLNHSKANSSYQGNELSEKNRARMGKILTSYIPDKRYNLNLTDRILVEVKESVQSLYKTCEFKHILPHFERPDIVVCFDKKRKTVIPIHADCPKDYTGQILTRKELLGQDSLLKSDLVSIAIVVAGWNNVVRGPDRLTGLFDLKLKQLRILQHKYIVIYWYEWRELETADRQKFLQRKLSSLMK